MLQSDFFFIHLSFLIGKYILFHKYKNVLILIYILKEKIAIKKLLI